MHKSAIGSVGTSKDKQGARRNPIDDARERAEPGSAATASAPPCGARCQRTRGWSSSWRQGCASPGR
jgi:hypothetical protein